MSGATGPVGPAGPKQILQVTQVHGEFVQVPPGTFRIAVAESESGEVATGGGILITEAGTNINEINPDRFDMGSPLILNPTSWTLSYTNPGPENVTIQAVAECTKLVDAP